jgi:hypothetical protein
MYMQNAPTPRRDATDTDSLQDLLLMVTDHGALRPSLRRRVRPPDAQSIFGHEPTPSTVPAERASSETTMRDSFPHYRF